MASSGASPVDPDGRCVAPAPPPRGLGLGLPPRPQSIRPPPVLGSPPVEGPFPPPCLGLLKSELLRELEDFEFHALFARQFTSDTFQPLLPENPALFKRFHIERIQFAASIFDPYFNSYLQNHVNYVGKMASGSELAEEKAESYVEFCKNIGLSMNCDVHKKTVHNHHGDILMKWNHLKLLAPGLPSIPLCSKVLVESFHGIESLDACFTWDIGEQIIWALPIERPLGPGAPATDFWLDSGCVHHVVGEESIIDDRREPPPGKMIKIADGSLMRVHSVGTIKIPGYFIPEVYFVPGAVVNLISPGQLAVHHNIISTFDAVSCVLWTGQSIDLVGEGIRDERRGLYRLTFLLVP